MILTRKVKHNADFTRELSLAKKVAEFAIANDLKSSSTSPVKHFGLKSAIACQVLRKYTRSKTIKSVNSVMLTIPSQHIKVKGNVLFIPCLKLTLFPVLPVFEKINQVEIDKEFAYISFTVKEPTKYAPTTVIGVDRNTTGHVLVASNLNTGKVLKLGKSCNHVHCKYKEIRRSLQKAGKFSLLKKIKCRESNIVRNLNHQISKVLIEVAKDNKAVVVLEDLEGIRKTAKTRKKQRYSLHSWSFYQLSQMIEYKSKKFGVPVVYVAPQYTSQRCSHCGHIEAGNRKGKVFHCVSCGVVENADANAGFNIASLYHQGISQFCKESDLQKGSTDTPKGALS